MFTANPKKYARYVKLKKVVFFKEEELELCLYSLQFLLKNRRDLAMFSDNDETSTCCLKKLIKK